MPSGFWPWVSVLCVGGEQGHHRPGSTVLAGMLGIFTPHAEKLSEQNPCSHSLPHLSSPWLNSSWPPARTSETHQSWMWFWHSCQRACYGYKTRWELCWTVLQHLIKLHIQYQSTENIPILQQYTQSAAAMVRTAFMSVLLKKTVETEYFFNSKMSLIWNKVLLCVACWCAWCITGTLAMRRQLDRCTRFMFVWFLWLI